MAKVRDTKDYETSDNGQVPPPLSSLSTVTFALEAGTRMTALYRQIGELSMRAHKHYKPTLSLNTADRSEKVSFT